MPKCLLSSANGKRITLAVEVAGRTVELCGLATYESSPNGSNQLRITIDQQGSKLDVIISEAEWTGAMRVDSTGKSDFQIALTEGAFCTT